MRGLTGSRLARCSSVVVVAVACGACAQSADDGVASRTIRVAYSGQTGFVDLPSLLAHQRLRAKGYRVEETNYAATDLAVEALSRGAADFGVGAVTSAWQAAARGAPVRTLMQHATNPHRLVVVPDISSCAGLDGRRLALHGEAAVGTALVRAFLAEECPDARPNIRHVPDSSSRAAALLAGGIDAATIEIGVLMWLEHQAPGRFRILSDFAQRWPLITTTGVQVNTDFAAAHRDVVLDYLRARLKANRDLLSDEGMLAAEAARALGPSDQWPEMARAFIKARAWSADGGLGEGDVRTTLAFFANDTLTEASAGLVADLTFLEEARASTAR